MDARLLYELIKPNLELLSPSEKIYFLKLISSRKAKKVTAQHRKVLPVKKAKERLKEVVRAEVARQNSSGVAKS